MIGFARLAVFALIGMTIAFWLLRLYFSSTQREELEKSWDGDHPDGGDNAARDAHIEKGMADYRRGLGRKLIWLVYVIPTLAILLLLYLTNDY
jgi:hypothetical protein